MNRASTSLVLLLALVTFWAGPETVLAGETRVGSEADQPVRATLVFRDSPLKTMTEIPFRLELAGAADDNPDIHAASCELTMPAMPMPENRPDLTCSERSCTGTALFTMAGAWRATFGLILADGSHASLVFDIEMVQLK